MPGLLGSWNRDGSGIGSFQGSFDKAVILTVACSQPVSRKNQHTIQKQKSTDSLYATISTEYLIWNWFKVVFPFISFWFQGIWIVYALL